MTNWPTEEVTPHTLATHSSTWLTSPFLMAAWISLLSMPHTSGAAYGSRGIRRLAVAWRRQRERREWVRTILGLGGTQTGNPPDLEPWRRVQERSAQDPASVPRGLNLLWVPTLQGFP